MSVRRIGILTGGGDVPGLNSVIKTVVYRGGELACEVLGIRRGWEGLTHVNLEDPASRARYIQLLDRETRTIDRTGSTHICTARALIRRNGPAAAGAIPANSRQSNPPKKGDHKGL